MRRARLPYARRLARELKTNQHDMVGSTGIIVNVAKVRGMCCTNSGPMGGFYSSA
jgi:hypothetical protein